MTTEFSFDTRDANARWAEMVREPLALLLDPEYQAQLDREHDQSLGSHQADLEDIGNWSDE